MKFRKATKSDSKEYQKLKRLEGDYYKNLLNEKRKIPPLKEIEKEFSKIISSRTDFIFVATKEKKIAGYIHGNVFKNLYNKGGWVEDIFVKEDYRRKGIATKLLKEFTKVLKKKNIKNIHLSVNSKNNKAFEMYKNMGFKIHHYSLKKKLGRK